MKQFNKKSMAEKLSYKIKFHNFCGKYEHLIRFVQETQQASKVSYDAEDLV